MTPQAQATFNRLASHFKDKELMDSDMLELIGGFAMSDPSIAQAMSYHARDYIVEVCHNVVTYTQIILETYRRTFFDPKYISKYPLENAPMNDEQLAIFVKGITEQIDMIVEMPAHMQ